LSTEKEESDILRVISETVASTGLLNAGAVETLHVSIGSSDTTCAALVRKELQLVKCWELVIAKCQAGTTPLQVTEFCESKELNWW
jgi:hypothetical protein